MANHPHNPFPLPEDGAPAPAAPLPLARSHAMQRLQVGVFGLAAMILLVGLANIFIRNARENDARVVPEAAPTVEVSASGAPASDPLADAGVVPDLPSAAPAPAPSGEAVGPQLP